MKRNIIIATLFAFGISMQSAAQQKPLCENWTFGARLGYNIGGTAPLPMPEEFKTLDRYKAGADFGLRLTAERHLNERWGLSVGVGLERKGMEGYVTVENFYTKLTQHSKETDPTTGETIDAIDQTTGFYTGREYTNESTTQITIPVTVRFHINDHWAVGVGPQMQVNIKKEFTGNASNGYLRMGDFDLIRSDRHLLEQLRSEIDFDNVNIKDMADKGIYIVPTGDRVEIPADKPASFDFSSEMRKFNYGAEIGVDFTPISHLLIFAHVDWSFCDIMHTRFENTISFPLYPIFGTIGVGYTF